jgi:hypothetical protein
MAQDPTELARSMQRGIEAGTGDPESSRSSRGPNFGARVPHSGGWRAPAISGGVLTDPQPEPIDSIWPNGMPYTVQFPDGDGLFAADLEHPAPLPRVGDLIEYIDERGASRRYRVREVLHTLQTSAAHRPTVAEGDASPQAIARVETEAQAKRPGGAGLLRSGLPKVFLEAVD